MLNIRICKTAIHYEAIEDSGRTAYLLGTNKSPQILIDMVNKRYENLEYGVHYTIQLEECDNEQN